MNLKNKLQSPFYTNTELSKLLGVSEVSIARYIKEYEKNRLVLIRDSGYNRVARNDTNLAILNSIVSDTNNFKNPVKYTTVKPLAQFYNLYSKEEINEITMSIKNKVLNTKFLYHGQGAERYNRYIFESGFYDRFNFCIKNQIPFLAEYANKNNIVYNLIELGPAKMPHSIDFVKTLYSLGILNKYMAIDISEEMLKFSKKIFEENLPARLYTECLIDFESSQIIEKVYDMKYDQGPEFKEGDKANCKVVNIIFATGATLSNFIKLDKLIENISNCLESDDFFSYDMPYKLKNFFKPMVIDKESTRYAFLTLTLEMLGLTSKDMIIQTGFLEDLKVGTAICKFTRNVELDIDGYVLRFKKNEELNILYNRTAKLVREISLAEKSGLSFANFSSSYDFAVANLLFQKRN